MLKPICVFSDTMPFSGSKGSTSIIKLLGNLKAIHVTAIYHFSIDMGYYLFLLNLHAQQRVCQKTFCSAVTDGSLAYAHGAALDFIVMSSVFHHHQPHTIDVKLALLMVTFMNPVVDVDPFDTDVITPIDDTNH